MAWGGGGARGAGMGAVVEEAGGRLLVLNHKHALIYCLGCVYAGILGRRQMRLVMASGIAVLRLVAVVIADSRLCYTGCRPLLHN